MNRNAVGEGGKAQGELEAGAEDPGIGGGAPDRLEVGSQLLAAGRVGSDQRETKGVEDGFFAEFDRRGVEIGILGTGDEVADVGRDVAADGEGGVGIAGGFWLRRY